MFVAEAGRVEGLGRQGAYIRQVQRQTDEGSDVRGFGRGDSKPSKQACVSTTAVTGKVETDGPRGGAGCFILHSLVDSHTHT